jgi:hypothetical protein
LSDATGKGKVLTHPQFVEPRPLSRYGQLNDILRRAGIDLEPNLGHQSSSRASLG